VAVALPWSTSATGILITVWVVVVLAMLKPAALRRELHTAAGGLPVLLFCLGAVGCCGRMSVGLRVLAPRRFVRLLVIPYY